jgi:hypothetical protein
MAHYIGLDVGTGSARACLIDEKGDILSVATKDIKTWHEKADYYVCLPLISLTVGTIHGGYMGCLLPCNERGGEKGTD